MLGIIYRVIAMHLVKKAGFTKKAARTGAVTLIQRFGSALIKVSNAPSTSAERRASMRWVQRLKRVFNIDIETCQACGGPVRIIACIEDPEVIKKILDHLDKQDTPPATGALPEGRAPPVGRLVAAMNVARK